MASQQPEKSTSKESEARERRREQNRLAQRNFRKRRQELQALRRHGKQKDQDTKAQDAEQTTVSIGEDSQSGKIALQQDEFDFGNLLPSQANSHQLSSWDFTLFGDSDHTRLVEEACDASLHYVNGGGVSDKQMTGVDVTESSANPITPPMSAPASSNEVSLPEYSDYQQSNRPKKPHSRSTSVSPGPNHVIHLTTRGFRKLITSESPVSTQKSSSITNTVARCAPQNTLASCPDSLDCMKESREFASVEVHLPVLSSSKPTIGKTILHLSTERGHAKIVRYVIECGAEVNSVDGAGRTALYYASSRGHTEIVGILLDAGADIDAVDGNGWTALHMAADCGHVEVLMLLVNDGADLDATIGRSSRESASAGVS